MGDRSEAQGLCILGKCSPHRLGLALSSSRDILFDLVEACLRLFPTPPRKNVVRLSAVDFFISVLKVLKLHCSFYFLHVSPKNGPIRCRGKIYNLVRFSHGKMIT